VANKMSEKKKSASQSEMSDSKAQASEKELKSEKSEKSAKAPARDERPSSSTRRETKSAPAPDKKSGGWRNWRLMRFAREAYQELRYKVTWPTFVQARNMTVVVIVLSTAIGLVLGLVDAGLYQVFIWISGK